MSQYNSSNHRFEFGRNYQHQAESGHSESRKNHQHESGRSESGKNQQQQHMESGRSEGGRKSSEGGRGDPEKASPAAVERYLKGIKFPAGKEDLINKANENNAPSDVMSVIERLPDNDYNSVTDIAKGVGEVN